MAAYIQGEHACQLLGRLGGFGRRATFCVRRAGMKPQQNTTANPRTKILDFRGFDSSRILKLRGGILMSTGNLLEIPSQQILAGIILVGRLGV